MKVNVHLLISNTSFVVRILSDSIAAAFWESASHGTDCRLPYVGATPSYFAARPIERENPIFATWRVNSTCRFPVTRFEPKDDLKWFYHSTNCHNRNLRKFHSASEMNLILSFDIVVEQCT